MTASNQQPTPLGLAPSFGFGDRLGVATPGHVAALRRFGGGIAPIFAQQSIREMTRTNRSPQQVMDNALAGARKAGYAGVQGADADHLKTPQDVDRTAASGFCFFTIDPSDFVEAQADNYDAATLAGKVSALGDEVKWVLAYAGKTIALATVTKISIDDTAAKRAAVKYGRAVNHAVSLARHIASVSKNLGRDYEIELSIDETSQPTTLAEHFIIADRCMSEGMKLVSLAPRFIGDFEKGVDYKGDVAALEKSLNDHAAIAKLLGPYKLSLHSGSDKLSIYPSFSRATAGLFHVKTAGTSYLEAIRAVIPHNPDLFRRIIKLARSRYETDRATYHVSATLAGAGEPSDITALEKIYLERWADVPAGRGFTEPARQILHTTFGSVLSDAKLKGELMQVLAEHPETYQAVLEEHFFRHLDALRAGL